MIDMLIRAGADAHAALAALHADINWKPKPSLQTKEKDAADRVRDAGVGAAFEKFEGDLCSKRLPLAPKQIKLIEDRVAVLEKEKAAASTTAKATAVPSK